MESLLARVTIFCFAASYSAALGLEVWHLLRPRPILRFVALGAGIAGLVAHIIFLSVQNIQLNSPTSTILLLAFVLAVFYLYGSLHHQGFAWGLFVLPIVLVLVLLATPQLELVEGKGSVLGQLFSFNEFWASVHGILILLAGVGVCVGFVASLMYFVQTYRLRNKVMPNAGIKLLNLERLESMNRRAILWSFPLLSAGLLVGVLLLIRTDSGTVQFSKIVSTLALWVVFAVLLYLRYGVHVRGRQMALWTVFAFVIMLLAFWFSHGGAA